MKKKLLYGIALNDSETPVRTQIKEDGKIVGHWHCKAYKCWNHILERCYSERSLMKSPTYAECSVCDEWLLFSNFKLWYDKNNIDGYEIDKDLLVRGNKVYSPDTCLFIHKSINIFLVDYNNTKFKLLNGVTLRGDSGKFRARCCNPITGKREALGNFKTEVEAHLVWAKRKNECAVMIANGDIHMCERTRNALLNIDFRQINSSEG